MKKIGLVGDASMGTGSLLEQALDGLENVRIASHKPKTPTKQDLLEIIRELVEAGRSFVDGWDHFCDKINWGASALSGESIQFMNEVPRKIKAAIAKAKEAEKGVVPDEPITLKHGGTKMKISVVLRKVKEEIEKAEAMHVGFKSNHEGIGVIREEYLELEAEVFSQKSSHVLTENMEKEAIQVAAMAVKFLCGRLDE